MSFPERRLRRLRSGVTMRRLVRETNLALDDLVYPLFVCPGEGIAEEITSMDGCCHFSPDRVATEAVEIARLGIPAVLLFGVPESKDEQGSEAWSPQGAVPQAIQAIKRVCPDLVVMTDVCLCAYTNHGHCGVLQDRRVDNDATCALLAKVALCHAEAGADVVAPSDMMDGRIAALRQALEKNGFPEVAILSYAAKYASAYYGPFREAAESTPSFGDRRTYQMDPGNAREALAEMALDIEEGADMLMVKPALPYLDIICRARQQFKLPIAAYNVSGEYMMIRAAAKGGYLDSEAAMLEALLSIKRAGADMIITYFAKEVAALLGGGTVRPSP